MLDSLNGCGSPAACLGSRKQKRREHEPDSRRTRTLQASESTVIYPGLSLREALKTSFDQVRCYLPGRTPELAGPPSQLIPNTPMHYLTVHAAGCVTQPALRQSVTNRNN